MGPTRKLLIHFSHFFTGTALAMLLGLITFPILTRLLTRDQYGMLGLVSTTVALAVALAKGGLSDGIIRFYRDYSSSAERLEVFTSTVVVRGVALSLVVCAAYALCIPYLADLLEIDRRYLICFYVMLPYLLIRPLNVIVFNYQRTLGQTVRYNMSVLATKALGIVLSLMLLLYVVRDLYGFFIGVALAEVLVGATLFWWLLKRYTVRLGSVSGSLSLELLRFGMPLVLTELMYLLLTYIDRYLIVNICGDDLLGLYSVGYNLPSYLNDLLMFSLSYAVVPIYTELFAQKGREATEEFLSKALRYYLIVVIPLCGTYASVSRDLIVVLASEKYAAAASFSPFILFGLVCLGMNSMVAAGLYVQKRTKLMLGIMAAALLVNVGLNLLLLPKMGALGAALATLVATVTSTALTWYFGRAYIRLVFPLGTVGFYGVVAACIYVLGVLIETGHEAINLVLQGGVALLIVAGAVLWREAEARDKFRQMLRVA